jgi:4-hydroxyphenylpyruvate dioxygenase-like putative hemolysin
MSMIERPKDEEVRTDSESVCSHDAEKDHVKDFQNSDRFLKKEAGRIMKERERWGLEGLVGGLEGIIINVEPVQQQRAIQELLDFTGYDIKTSFESENLITAVLKLEESADILVTSRKQEDNPYRQFNLAPLSKRLPNTRLETFVFRTSDIKKYYDIQRQRGVEFINGGIVTNDTHKILITKPSRYTGVSVGLIEWLDDSKSYMNKNDTAVEFDVSKPERDYLKNITYLDHAATRVRALDRDAAIIEFMGLTNYKFDFAIYVRLFNSITNVARLSAKDFAMVFTSGISPYVNDEVSGPTEKFIHNFNARTHHMAFITKDIEYTFERLKEDGMKFLIELVGSEEQGLKQTFTLGSKQTFLVIEYIHRYGDFTGFFTKDNVTLLTESTGKQVD